MEKIQAPAPSLLCLTFYARRKKIFLLLKYGRKPFLFCVKQRPATSSAPSAEVMLLRKHAQNRHIRGCLAHALERRLYLLLSGNTGDTRLNWLCLDLRRGPRFEHFDCPPLPEDIAWPPPEELGRTLAQRLEWPALTPALRRTLSLSEEAEQRALLVDLVAGGGDVFVYGEGEEAEVFAWPLPENLRRGRTESVFEDVLEAAALVGEARVFGGLEAARRKARGLPWERRIRRLHRLLVKLDTEEERLHALADKQKEALALQAELWRYPTGARLAEAVLFEADGPSRMTLNPRYTLREHMERLFHAAGRGRRGLALLEKRRGEVRREVEEAESALRLGLPFVASGREAISLEKRREKVPVGWPPPENFSAATEDDPAKCSTGGHAGERRPVRALPKKVQGFRSSDGFILLRGCDAAGNMELLRLAQPDDLWLHAEGGPGAHVLIRCCRREIPENSLLEAAQLAAVKSLWRFSPTACILCARVRHVRPVKGAKSGTVRVEKREYLLELAVDAEIEKKLERI